MDKRNAGDATEAGQNAPPLPAPDARPTNGGSIASENPDALKSIYAEASQWVRMVNTLVWTAGTVLFPIAVAAVGFAFERPSLKWPLAVGSLAVHGFWIYITYTYGHSAGIARDALMEVERRWGIPNTSPTSFYGRQGHVGRTRRGLPAIQRVLLAALIVAWLITLIGLL
jgi:hypothetical protein